MARVQYSDNQRTAPQWAGDYLDRNHLVPGGVKLDASQFSRPDAVTVTVGVAGAAQGATSIPVAALTGPIPSGTVLRFSVDEYARLSSAAATGATTLAVEALVNALESGDVATYAGVLTRSVPAGTLVGRTITERDASTAFGPAADGDVHPTGEVYFLAFDVPDVDANNDAVLYRPGSIVKENKLPFTFGNLSTTLKNEVRRLYRCTRGAA